MRIKLNSIYQRDEMAEVARRLPQWNITVKATVAEIPNVAIDLVLAELEVSRTQAREGVMLSNFPPANPRGRANAIGSVKRAIANASRA